MRRKDPNGFEGRCPVCGGPVLMRRAGYSPTQLSWKGKCWKNHEITLTADLDTEDTKELTKPEVSE